MAGTGGDQEERDAMPPGAQPTTSRDPHPRPAGRLALTMKYPHELYAMTNLRGFAGGFVAVGELSRARDVRVTLLERKPTTASFDVRWSTAE